MDVMGIAFRRELYLSTRQVYPPLQDREKGIHTRTQAKLLRKLGDNAYPFFFEVSDLIRLTDCTMSRKASATGARPIRTTWQRRQCKHCDDITQPECRQPPGFMSPCEGR